MSPEQDGEVGRSLADLFHFMPDPSAPVGFNERRTQHIFVGTAENITMLGCSDLSAQNPSENQEKERGGV